MMFVRFFGSGSIVRKISLLLLISLFATSLAFASGGGGGSGGGSSGGGSSGGGSSGGGSSGGSGSSGGGGGNGGHVFSVSEATYDKGKKIFFEYVVCESCPYADLEQTNEGLKEVWKKLKKDLRRKGAIGANLKSKERRSVKAFIRKRFNL